MLHNSNFQVQFVSVASVSFILFYETNLIVVTFLLYPEFECFHSALWC